MKATRDGFGDQLVISGKDNPDIIGLSADLGKATKIDKFGATYPDRIYEMGIAENNMVGVASGLSEYGYKTSFLIRNAFFECLSPLPVNSAYLSPFWRIQSSILSGLIQTSLVPSNITQ